MGKCYRKRPIAGQRISPIGHQLSPGIKFVSLPPILTASTLVTLERTVHQPTFALLGLMLSLPATALTFQTRLEKAQWQVEGDQFECRLSQPVADFGSGEFVRKAGEQAIFRLNASERLLGQGQATLLAAAAPWQPGRGDINLGAVKVQFGSTPLATSEAQAARLLTGLLEGRSPLVRHQSWQGDRTEVRLLPTHFAKAYAEFATCNTKLLPVNFEQIRNTQIGFASGIALDDLGQAKLDIILEYLKADPTVNRIQLDGHSDNSGNRLLNRDHSRRRALAVMEYLKAKGIAEEQITLRFHGERYPLVPNNSASNRAKNRRVTITLSREPEAEEAPAPTTPASSDTPAATS